MARLTIGELARRAGVGVETVRYYQRRGIFPEPARQPRGIREYPPECLELLRFIRRARGLGFTIREVERLVILRRARKDPNEVVEMLHTKAGELEKQVRQLEDVIKTLHELAGRADVIGPDDRWTLFDEDGEPAGPGTSS
jgi:MerR family transcriptional regulator, copper efflux regulator